VRVRVRVPVHESGNSRAGKPTDKDRSEAKSPLVHFVAMHDVPLIAFGNEDAHAHAHGYEDEDVYVHEARCLTPGQEPGGCPRTLSRSLAA